MEENNETKKKIVIKGSDVQNVGYRLFLLDVADSELIPYLNVKNVEKDRNLVEIFVGGDKDRVENFMEFIRENFPEAAKVESVEIVDDDYKGNIRTTESFSRWLSTHQLTKIANIGIQMLGKQDDMLGKQSETIGEIKNLRDDLKVYFDKRFDKIEKEVFQIKKRIKINS